MRTLVRLMLPLLFVASTVDAREPAADAPMCSEMAIESGRLFAEGPGGLLLESTRLPCSHPVPAGTPDGLRIRTEAAGSVRQLIRRESCAGREGFTVSGSQVVLCPSSCAQVEFAPDARLVVAHCQ